MDVMWLRIFLRCALACIIPVQLCALLHDCNLILKVLYSQDYKSPVKQFDWQSAWTLFIRQSDSRIFEMCICYLILRNSDLAANTFSFHSWCSFQSQLLVLHFHLKMLQLMAEETV